MTDASAQRQESAGVPAWVMTFADLMTLLMCFFVLLLAFSEMDAAKFKQLSGSMKEAFGVQSEVDVRTIPKGTSVVAREFSPGKPEPTALNVIRQFTINSDRNSLDALEEKKKREDLTKEHAVRIREALKAEIENGDVAVQTEGARIIIHILENASFDSGQANIRTEFLPVLGKISRLIDNNSGLVTVSGHTDNVPISSARFRSNWELSTSRAVSVTHEILHSSTISAERLTVSGHADTRSVANNDSAENRAKNRRVDITITRVNEVDMVEHFSIQDQ